MEVTVAQIVNVPNAAESDALKLATGCGVNFAQLQKKLKSKSNCDGFPFS